MAYNENCYFKVTKNKITRLALKETKYQHMDGMFRGPTAIGSSKDPVMAAKVLVDFAKENEKLVIIGGGLDDVWHNRETDEINIVDYKSTAGKRNEEGTALNPISLFGTYKEAYKNQMDMYQWILKQQGFNVSNTGYFVYVNGDQHFQDGMLEEDADAANMKFDVQLIEYEGNSDWVEQSILDVKACLDGSDCTDHADLGFGPKGDKQCEYSKLFESMRDHQIVF